MAAASNGTLSSRKRTFAQVCTPPSWEHFTSFETYIFDCDGVIWGIDPADTKTSVATINHLISLGKRVMFVTNNSNKRRADFVKELETKGIDFTGRSEEEKLGMMISAAYTTAQYLHKEGLRKPFVITSDKGVLEELKLVGVESYVATIDDDGNVADAFKDPAMNGSKPDVADFICDNADVDCIVMGWDMAFTARKIVTAVNFIRFHEDVRKGTPGYKPMPIIACAGDASGVFKTANFEGQTVKVRAVGNGAMADAIARCFDPPRSWLDMGKPSDALLALLGSPEAYDVDMSKALMVGDTLQTDIVFGNRGNMATLLVLSGVTTKRELEEAVSEGDTSRLPAFTMAKLGAWIEKFGELPPKGELDEC